MASSSAPKTSYHARSISLPSRSHPAAEQLEEQLCRLRSSQSASTSSSSLSLKLNGLNDLYSCVDEFLQLPSNLNAKSVEGTLDGSLRLLDVCSTTRDALLLSKERLQDVQSALRRRCSGELSIANEAAEYLNTRKAVKKAIKNCLKNIKVANKNELVDPLVSILKDVEEVTVDTFKSLLSYIAGAKQTKKSSWSIVSKLIHQSDKEVVSSNTEFAAVDATMASFCPKKKTGINMSQVEILRSQMMQLESEIQDFDKALESLFRNLVKTRATLLNILSN